MKFKNLLLMSVLGITCFSGSIAAVTSTIKNDGTDGISKTILNEGQTAATYDVTNITVTTKPKTEYKMGEVFDASGLKFNLVYTVNGASKTKEGTSADCTWTHEDEKLGLYVHEIVFSLKNITGVSFTVPVTVTAAATLVVDVCNNMAEQHYTELDPIDLTKASVYSRAADGTVEQLTTSDCTFYDGDTEIAADKLSAYVATAGKHTFKAKKGDLEGTFDITIQDSTKVVYPYHIQAENCEGVQETVVPTSWWWNVPAMGGDSDKNFTGDNECPTGVEGSNAKLEDQALKINVKVPTTGKYDLIARCYSRSHNKASEIQVSINSDSNYTQVVSDDNLLPSNQSKHISRGVGNFSWFYGRFGTYTLNAGDNSIYFKGPGWDDKKQLEIDYFMVQPENTITDTTKTTLINLRNGTHEELNNDNILYVKQNEKLTDIFPWAENITVADRPADFLFTELSMRIGGMNGKADFNGEKYYPAGIQVMKSFIAEVPVYEGNITGLDTSVLGYQSCTATAYSYADGQAYSADFTVCVIK